MQSVGGCEIYVGFACRLRKDFGRLGLRYRASPLLTLLVTGARESDTIGAASRFLNGRASLLSSDKPAPAREPQILKQITGTRNPSANLPDMTPAQCRVTDSEDRRQACLSRYITLECTVIHVQRRSE
jgi:hypothetical protein